MSTPLIPQEIYLLERYCQPEPFEKVRDAWAAMVKHAEVMLDRFMRQLPPDYRNRPLPNQPDRVWGERVLRNFRDTLQQLNESYIELSHGDLNALDGAGGVASDLRGQRMDYPEDWMDEVEPGAANRFSDLGLAADLLARPIVRTARQSWDEGDLTVHYSDRVKAPLNPPASWPIYRLNPKVRVRSGDRTPKTGIYLPDVDRGFPALLIENAVRLRGKAAKASVPTYVLPDGSQQDVVPTTWTLVERIADSGGGIPGAVDPIQAGVRMRCEAGQPCPREGFWITPAKTDSRRRFTRGELMPAVRSDYGYTIWEWDEQQ